MENEINPIEERGLLSAGDYIMIPANVRIVAGNRVSFLGAIPKYGSCVEVGVAQGGFSVEILRCTKPSSLYLIDGWDLIDDYPKATSRHNESVCRELLQDDPRVRIIKKEATFTGLAQCRFP